MHPKLLSEDLILFKDSFRRWVQNEVVPYHDQWEKDEESPREIYRKAGNNSFLLVNQPLEFGGQGQDFRFSAAIIEELALGGATGIPLWLHSDVNTPYLAEFGSVEQKMKWLPKMAAGDILSALAFTEPGAGSDMQAIRTTAVLNNNTWVLNGMKTFVSNGAKADLVIVAAVIAQKDKSRITPLSLFLVESNSPGFERGKPLAKLGLKAQDTAELSFINCEIPKENLLGQPETARLYMEKNLPQERLCIAIHSLTSASRALNLTLDYVRQRQVFGKTLMNFQNTRFKIAEMATEINICQAFIDQCILGLVEKSDISIASAMAKIKATELLGQVTDQCLQLFGGYGYMLEYPISRAFTDARAQRICGGTTEIMKEIIAASYF